MTKINIKTTQQTQKNITKQGEKWDNAYNFRRKRKEAFVLSTATQKQSNQAKQRLVDQLYTQPNKRFFRTVVTVCFFKMKKFAQTFSF